MFYNAIIMLKLFPTLKQCLNVALHETFRLTQGYIARKKNYKDDFYSLILLRNVFCFYILYTTNILFNEIIIN